MRGSPRDLCPSGPPQPDRATPRAAERRALFGEARASGRFMIQPRYQSVVGFKTPMELRVIALWGKVPKRRACCFSARVES